MTYWILWLVLGCSSSPSEASCVDLNEADCRAAPKCLPTHAFPTECVDGQSVREDSVYAGCYDWSAFETGACDDLGGVCWRPSAPGELYDFPNMCIPEGWECNIGKNACGS